MSSVCEECQGSFGCFGKPCHECEKPLCSTCAGRHPLVPFDAERPDVSNDLSRNQTVRVCCRSCFRRKSTLDFSRTTDEIIDSGQTKGDGKTTTMIMVHGGGGSRMMFHGHAQLLSDRGYRCVLVDLPGHGSLMETELTLKTCVETLESVLKRYRLRPAKDDDGTTIYVGGSLGAYVGMYCLSKLSRYFSGAVLLDCGQDVGPDAGTKARMGIWFLKLLSGQMSNHGLAKMMLSVSQKSPADYRLVETCFGAGTFFDQGPAQCECLRAVDPTECIPTFDFPVMFANGSEDHRDSEEKWLSLCKDQESSSLKVYQGGDHFFMHDSRFVDDLVGRIDDFAKQVVLANKS